MRRQFRLSWAKLHQENFCYLKQLPLGLLLISFLINKILLSNGSAVLACGGTGDTCNHIFGRAIHDSFNWMFDWIFALFIKGLLIVIMFCLALFGLTVFLDRKNK